jgi:glycosyltransferase involved in cell wall biosynthesis
MQKRLSILISTLAERIYSTETILANPIVGVEYLIVHQVSEADAVAYNTFYERFQSDAIRFIVQHSVGTGVSRNCAMENATGELLYICDDDIQLTENFYASILLAAEENPTADIFTFMIKDTSGNPYKKYLRKKQFMSLHKTAKVSNVEMVLRKTFVDAAKLRYDTRFGLGTIFNTGEEFILLADAIKSGGKILFVPEYIAIHPKESSGKAYSQKLVEAKGAMINRVYGMKFWLINFVYAVSKYHEYKNSMHLLRFLKYIYTGSLQFNKYD